MGVKPSSTKKAVQKPQSKPVVETPLTRTEKKRNKGFETWLESFKARIHQSITNPRPSSVLEEDQEAKDIEPELSTVYVRAESKDDLGPIFDEEEEPFDYPHQGPLLVTRRHLDDDLGSIFDEEDDHLDDDSVPIFDEEEEPEALVQPFVCKEYDPVKLLRHEEGLQHFIFEPGEETPKPLIMVCLIGLIHEVLDREKLMGLIQNVEALFQIKKSVFEIVQEKPNKNLHFMVE
ncbi:hypothetical protein DY000_02017418 [Brassica cretica]|uniref:Uncharacterized protein n=1 Tax=Brassica cretica TaxID=69181 RepID=A0ABQ7CSS3_BRACR|nr:hypothetical protein DY000_02017418 [Brassica cretica]